MLEERKLLKYLPQSALKPAAERDSIVRVLALGIGVLISQRATANTIASVETSGIQGTNKVPQTLLRPSVTWRPEFLILVLPLLAQKNMGSAAAREKGAQRER